MKQRYHATNNAFTETSEVQMNAASYSMVLKSQQITELKRDKVTSAAKPFTVQVFDTSMFHPDHSLTKVCRALFDERSVGTTPDFDIQMIFAGHRAFDYRMLAAETIRTKMAECFG
jgi:hypothetical protein